MSNVSRWSQGYWIVVLVGALGFATWLHGVRERHVAQVSELAGGSDLRIDPGSATGYAGGVRRLVVPAPHFESARTIMQTQQMLETGEWRVRHVKEENAPHGREERSASIVRWWLASLALLDSLLSGRSSGLAVERAASIAEPTVHVLLVLVTTALVARRLGGAAAVVVAVGLVAVFPLAASFVAGLPTREPFALAAAMWSVLGIALGHGARKYPENGDSPAREMRGWYAVAGVAGGIGLWIDVATQLPVLAGVFLARVVGVSSRVSGKAGDHCPARADGVRWRVWSSAGAGTTMAAWLLEYAPGHLDLLGSRASEVHPWYAIAWLGAGWIASRVGGVGAGVESRLSTRSKVLFAAAVGALLAPLAAAMLHSGTFPSVSNFSGRTLARLPAFGEGTNPAQWLELSGFDRTLVAAVVPVLLLAPVGWALVRARGGKRSVEPLLVALVPALLVAALGCFDLGRWAVFDALLLVTVVAATSYTPFAKQWFWTAGVGLAAVAGGALMVQTRSVPGEDGLVAVDALELRALVERDFAHWLARWSAVSDAVVLGPPGLTTTLSYYGGFRGLGTPHEDNEAGFQAAMRIAAATSSDEARALVESRKVAYVVHPTWEPFLDEYARLGSLQPEASLVALLNNWLPPRWLRPLPYRLPDVPEFREEFVAVYEVTDVQDNATALSRLAEYFAEIGWLGHARRVSDALEEAFPGELTAQTARAQVAAAMRDADAFGRAIGRVEAIATESRDGWLEWDRRVALAIVLAQANRAAQSREQLVRCLDEIDDSGLRSLTPGSLHRFLVLLERNDLAIEDADFRQVARRLDP